MKKILLTLLSLYLLTLTPLWAQVSTPSTPVVRKGARATLETPKAQSSTSRTSVHEEGRIANALQSASWLRSVYRLIDLTTPANAPLYYPEVTTPTRANLFAQICQLYQAGKLRVYEYLDGEEQLDEAHLLPFRDFLDRFHIPYKVEGKGAKEVLTVQPSDLPTSEVKSYYLKEAYLFDEATSTYDRLVLALCPILSTVGDYGAVNMPLFWVEYEALQPYLSDQLIPLSKQNAAKRASLDDFFTLHLYEGEIIRADHLLGRSLVQSSTSAEELKKQQARIEDELKAFGSRLFLPDSTLRHRPSTQKAKKVRTPKASPSTKSSRGQRSTTRSIRDRG